MMYNLSLTRMPVLSISLSTSESGSCNVSIFYPSHEKLGTHSGPRDRLLITCEASFWGSPYVHLAATSSPFES
jgi:hypothetical protein